MSVGGRICRLATVVFAAETDHYEDDENGDSYEYPILGNEGFDDLLSSDFSVA